MHPLTVALVQVNPEFILHSTGSMQQKMVTSIYLLICAKCLIMLFKMVENEVSILEKN